MEFEAKAVDTRAVQAHHAPRRDSTNGEVRTTPKPTRGQGPHAMPDGYSIRYARGQRTLIHRPFPESILEQVNYALWFTVPEVR